MIYIGTVLFYIWWVLSFILAWCELLIQLYKVLDARDFYKRYGHHVIDNDWEEPAMIFIAITIIISILQLAIFVWR